jgi:replicative DNA helicase
MSALRALPEPVPGVRLGDVLISALAAVRDEHGITATVRAVRDRVLYEATIAITTPEGRVCWARYAAPHTGIDARELEAAVQQLGSLVDDALRKLPEEPEWQEPLPFPEPPRPAFPLHVFPANVGAFVQGVATATGTAVDLAAMLVLAVVSLCTSRRLTLKAREGWQESMGLYVLVSAVTGERKGPVYEAVTAEMRRYESDWNREHKAEIRASEAKGIALEQRLAGATKALATAKTGDGARDDAEETLKVVAAELERHTVLASLTLYMGDGTPEAFPLELQRQGGTLGVFGPEGGLLRTLIGSRYSETGAPNLDALLQAYSGEEIRQHRISRPPVRVPKPTVAMGVCLQPAVVRDLMRQPDVLERGLLARILYVEPVSTIGTRETNPPALDDDVAEQYARLIRDLLTLREERDQNDMPIRRHLTLSLEARARLEAFLEWLEPQLAPGGALASADGWCNKLAGTAARIAGNLHMMDSQPTNALHHPIRAATMDAAIELCREYLLPHAQRVLGSIGASPATEDARAILAWFRRNPRESFTRRDVCADLRSRFPEPTTADAALLLLVDLCYLKELEPDRQKRGRKPDAVYTVNPKSLARNTQITHNSSLSPLNAPSGADSAYFVHFAPTHQENIGHPFNGHESGELDAPTTPGRAATRTQGTV